MGVSINTPRLAAPGCCSDSRIPVLVAHSPPVGPPRSVKQFISAGLWSLQLTWQQHAVRGTIAAAPLPLALRQFQLREQDSEAAKAAVADEAALLAEDLCAASPQHSTERFSADRSVLHWRLAGY